MDTALGIIGMILLGSFIPMVIILSFMLIPIAIESYIDAKEMWKRFKRNRGK